MLRCSADLSLSDSDFIFYSRVRRIVMSSSPHSTIIPSDSDINDAIPPPQVIIALPAVLPPSLVLSLSPMFDSRDSFPSKEISLPKDTETPVKLPILVSSSSSVGFHHQLGTYDDHWEVNQSLEKPDESDTCYNVHL
ncbi:hypothetical protein Tco_0750666 [Tanacetum coccineum]|uniref:Uncharacterized protein n=1 Tax=Tanacetum coccineum TaxID=301880 RepID=A0ABQ4Z2U0_9ASTR